MVIYPGKLINSETFFAPSFYHLLTKSSGGVAESLSATSNTVGLIYGNIMTCQDMEYGLIPPTLITSNINAFSDGLTFVFSLSTFFPINAVPTTLTRDLISSAFENSFSSKCNRDYQITPQI
jgi:hypothetical protein